MVEKVGYMGIPGSFSELAAQKLLEQMGMEQMELIPLVCAKNILEAMRDGSVSYGVLAVRNTTAGPVSEFIQAFHNVEYEMLGEYVLPIHHCLFKRPEVSMSGLLQVASHPQAIRQTCKTRMRHWPDLAEKEIEDTAIGAEKLAKGELPDTTAVICSINAGQAWDLDMIARDIEDSSENKTTFWLMKLC